MSRSRRRVFPCETGSRTRPCPPTGCGAELALVSSAPAAAEPLTLATPRQPELRVAPPLFQPTFPPSTLRRQRVARCNADLQRMSDLVFQEEPSRKPPAENADPKRHSGFPAPARCNGAKTTSEQNTDDTLNACPLPAWNRRQRRSVAPHAAPESAQRRVRFPLCPPNRLYHRDRTGYGSA